MLRQERAVPYKEFSEEPGTDLCEPPCLCGSVLKPCLFTLPNIAMIQIQAFFNTEAQSKKGTEKISAIQVNGMRSY